MSTQSEAALEAGLIATLRQMDYDYVQIVEEDNLYANFKRQLEIHNRKRLEEHGRTCCSCSKGMRQGGYRGGALCNRRTWSRGM